MDEYVFAEEDAFEELLLDDDEDDFIFENDPVDREVNLYAWILYGYFF